MGHYVARPKCRTGRQHFLQVVGGKISFFYVTPDYPRPRSIPMTLITQFLGGLKWARAAARFPLRVLVALKKNSGERRTRGRKLPACPSCIYRSSQGMPRFLRVNCHAWIDTNSLIHATCQGETMRLRVVFKNP